MCFGQNGMGFAYLYLDVTVGYYHEGESGEGARKRAASCPKGLDQILTSLLAQTPYVASYLRSAALNLFQNAGQVYALWPLNGQS